MTVTDKQVATLRAQLAGNLAEHKRLFRQLDWQPEGLPYTALIDAAFFEAVDRRFANGGTAGDVIAYVADVRSRFDEAAEAVDPEAAERLILKVLGQGSIADMDSKTAITAKQFILVALIVDEHLQGAALDEFLAQARELADQWLT
jgi:hypothetical protein